MPMKQVLQFRHCALGASLLCAASLSCALTLGRARGAAVLGQPFQLTVPVQMAEDEDGTNLCFDAEVFYGDLRQDLHRVSVVTERNAAGQPMAVRVNSRIPVDEPVVSVSVRSGCGAVVSRRYVLLADMLSDVDTPSVTKLLPAESEAATGRPQRQDGEVAGRVGSPLVVSASQGAAVSGPQNDQMERHPSKNRRGGQSAPHAKLTLAPLDIPQNEELRLRSSSELVAPVEDDAKVRLAAAALWKSLNLTPQEVLEDAARLESLEANVRQLKDLTASNQRQMQMLLARIDSAESQKYSNILVYLLVAALIALSAALVWCWRELRGAGHSTWWGGHSQSGAADVGQLIPSADALQEQQAAVSSQSSPRDTAKTPSTQPSPQTDSTFADVDIDLSIDVSSVAALPFTDSKTQESKAFDPAATPATGLRSTNAQAAVDARHQAEFFMTLGQYPEAIALLEKFIADHAEANPWVYLDLLKALHTLSRKDSFDHYRKEFNALFAGQVPAYASFSQSGNGIESHSELCSHLTSLWPSKAALEFIEKCLLRDSHWPEQPLFDLDAFKELLLLHAVLTRTYGENNDGFHQFHALKTSNNPSQSSAEVTLSSALAEADADRIDLKLADLPRASDHLIEFDTSSFSTKPSPDPSS